MKVLKIASYLSLGWLLLAVYPLHAFNGKYAIKIGNHYIDRLTFDWLYSHWIPNKEIDKTRFSEELVDNRLIYQYTLETQPQLLKLSEVDYSLSWHINRQIINFCHSQFPQNILSSEDENPSRKFTLPQLKKLVGNFKLTSRLGYVLSDEQKHSLDKVILLPLDKYKRFSLLTLFNNLNIQDKQRLFEGDHQIISREIGFQISYKKYCKNKSESELSMAKAIFKSLHFRNVLRDHYGISLNQHGNNDSLRTFKKQVTSKDIEDFYNAHRESFKFKQKVKYAAWEFSSRRLSETFKDQLDNGQVEKKTQWHLKNNEWLNNLAFSLPVNKVSEPILSPVKTWTLVSVVDVKYDYYPLESETVRYIASLEIAKKHARKRYEFLLRKLKKQIRITINV
ncbi:peptidylprolyl isomerase [Aliikangiella sp. G2MR2-5]|uniref:peptidylprolyl isomerase n=1 Tax=Aliikangiella sp. G2MR2-5 TaxID=2788943 RepID=UPI0018A9440C|nr:peptidylprolyl isomerase [Aliikangiella sp. G2MR2-5]